MADRPGDGGSAPAAFGVGEVERLGVAVRRAERPGSEKEVQTLLAAAHREGWTVLPVGGATSPGVGVLPETVDLAVDTTGLDRVLAFDCQNLTLAVLAGMTVDAVNGFLAEQGRGFFLPLDPPQSDRATLGGCYGANASGPLRHLYGTLRDQVLGVRGVDARGREVGFGGKTVKNVSGYDVTKFLVGSAGSLALITSISLRCLPIPEASALCEAGFADPTGPVEAFLSELRGSVLVPSAVVLTEGPAGGCRALVAFEGHPGAVERQVRDLEALVRRHGGTAQCRDGRQALQAALREAMDPEPLGPDRISVKVCVPIAAGARTLAALRPLVDSPRKLALLAGTGVIHVSAAAGEGVPAERVRALARAEGGHAVPVRGHRSPLGAWRSRGDDPVARYVLGPLKEQLDPTHVFPPIF
ncbi:MAG: FAD-binding oxidoreductase [Deferrisomatales bacterium]